ncbi:MAG TPA: glutathione S-transferase N-terminal domain-containing protein [Thermoleophilaceae bacterium]|jgi:glutathione S-transferase
MAILYRCKTPTNRLCACGKVARRLDRAGIAYEEIRVPVRRRDRDELEELTGQTWAPVLIIGDEVIHESHRICEHIEWRSERGPEPAAAV